MPDPELRASLVASQVVGLAFTRFVVQLDPIASASVEELVAAIGPTIQRYLAGEIRAGSDAEAPSRPGRRAGRSRTRSVDPRASRSPQP